MLLLQIEIDSKWLDANLTAGSSISMEETSQVWSLSGGRSSIPFTLSVHENQHIVGNVSDMRGSSVFKRLYGARFRLYVGGILFRTGVVHLDSSVPVTDEIEIELVGNGKEWAELIEDLDCRKVPLMSDVLLGTTLSSKSRITENAYTPYIKPHLKGAGSMIINGKDNALGGLERHNPDVGEFVIPNVMKPYRSSVNESEPYSASHPYCNFRICWQKKDKDGNKLHKYIAYEADRINTSPCFYVLYFFDCLFKYLNVRCTSNRMKDFDEFKRLAFLNTACRFDVRTNEDKIDTVKPNDLGITISIDGTKIEGNYDIFDLRNYKTGEAYVTISATWIAMGNEMLDVMNAYATPENFPNKSVKSVLDAIQNLFGMRILYNSSKKETQIILVRDVLKQRNVVDIPCRIVSVYPIYEHKDGFVLRYASDTAEDNVDERNLERDTVYQQTHLASKRTDLTYEQLASNISAYDKTFYADPVTGNGYVIKVDKDATTEKELFPSVMEASQFCRVEYGDCSEKEFTEEISIDANPVIMAYFDRTTGESVSTNDGTGSFAYFADVEMVDEGDDFKATQYRKITFDYLGGTGDAVTGYVKSRFEIPITIKHTFRPTYDMSSSLDSPLDSYDTGLMLGFMRGPGNKSGKEIINENYDGEGNSQWVTVSSNSAFHSDTMDMFGNTFDYNDSGSGTPVHIPDKGYAITMFSVWFPKSNAATFETRHIVNPSRLMEAGYDVYYVYSTYFAQVYSAFDVEILYTPVKDDGTIISSPQMLAYLAKLQVLSANIEEMFAKDAQEYRVLIGYFDDSSQSETWTNILNELETIYYGEGTGTIVIPNEGSNGFGGDAQRISLKLKAEKLIDGKYLPVTGAGAARRGIFDNFYEDYAYWVTHRKLAHIEAEVELADLINLDMTKKYRIGDYVGFLKSCNYNVTDSGIGIVTFELYYL